MKYSMMLYGTCMQPTTRFNFTFTILIERVKIKLLMCDAPLEGVLLIVVHDHVNGPPELFPLGLVVNFLDGDLMFLAPGHADPVTREM